MKTVICLGISLALVASATAEDKVSWFTLAGGGSMGSQGDHTLVGTIGQPMAARVQAANHTLVAGFWGFGNALAAHRPPALRMILEGNQVVLAWPDWAVSYQLQMAPSLVAPDWDDVINKPTIVGSEFHVTLRLQSGNAFFRLKKD